MNRTEVMNESGGFSDFRFEETPAGADSSRSRGSFLRDHGRTSQAEPFYLRSLAISSRIGYEAGVAHALNCLASLAQRRGDLVTAAHLVTDALIVAEQGEDWQLIGMLQQNLGMFADIRGNPAEAMAHYLLSLRTLESTSDARTTAWVLNNLGVLHSKEERYHEAECAFESALELSRDTRDAMAEGIVQENLAELGLIRGALDEAQRHIDRALEIAQQRGDDVRRASALKLRGAHARLKGRPAQALETLRQALSLSAVGEDALLGAECLYQFGLALHDNGEPMACQGVMTTALDAFDRIAARQWVDRVRDRLSTGVTGRYL
jgi:tetratricopeptide (TPR) repeat protein